MLDVVNEPAIRARMHAISVETYHRLGQVSESSERTELIRGVIIDQMFKSPLHASIVELLRDHLSARLPSGWLLRQEQPLTLLDSEPEPDIAVVPGPRSSYFSIHPTTAALVIEICVTSEEIDRVKLAIYAGAGVRESWLILAEERIVERHTEPRGASYLRVERAKAPGTLESTVFPHLTLPPSGLFPIAGKD